MDLKNLEKILENEPKYRIKQAKEAVFQKIIEDWDKATNLPKDLREKLSGECPLEISAEVFPSEKNDCLKARIVLKDGLKIETVLMRHNDKRNTVCVSCQVGCALACEFCATGRMGFKRNLQPLEIVEQVLFFSRYLKKEGRRVTNVVFMGMGEPFLNYDTVMAAIRILNDKNSLNIGARRISVSTVGIPEGIKKLSEEKLQINLAVSLHAADNVLRSKIMPINKKYPIERVLRAVDDYIKKQKRKVMFEYLLIKDVNDSDSCAIRFGKMMKKPFYFLNLILYNPTGIFKPPEKERVKEFKNILEKMGVDFSERYRFGRSAKAACGQLASLKTRSLIKSK